jgi:FkbM family methyltransferase
MSKDFELKDSLFRKYILQYKAKLFHLLTAKSLPLFFRAGDTISTDPQVFGYWEVHIKGLIDHYAQEGFGDFFIDIGANIGLTSCQSGNAFSEVHCFEPNPDCFSILKINTKLSLSRPLVFLNNFGLGAEAVQSNLYLPRGNWGGGFIHDENNSYTDSEIGEKDGYEGFSADNYDVMPIKIESANEKLSYLFESLLAKNLTSGFIKIDVEGYEPLIVKSIAQTIPKDFRAVMLFECWTKDFDAQPLIDIFKGRATAYKLVRSPEKNVNRFIRLLKIIKNFGYVYELIKFNKRSNAADIVFIIDKG